ncbi:dimethylsulfonioproprionate lyase family protein [Ensifer aridi]|uniref:dimethylsulfonioproprionate lyase family protein n=1 Tax=Ensifer aridi TaxID=1708715 RepID=UPI000A122D88|nr:dimethylsulfonioproprionate lyase family protein [Ensifer aridi]
MLAQDTLTGALSPRPATLSDDLRRSTLLTRLTPLQQMIDGFCSILQANNTTAIVNVSISEVVDKLGAIGKLRSRGGQANALPLRDELVLAVQTIEPNSKNEVAVARGVGHLADDLDWYCGESGPFASVNFDRGHAHAVVLGPEGLEERFDLRMGVTLMAAYTRFPDHSVSAPQVVLALSDAEFWSESDGWQRAQIGSFIVQPEGPRFAMRCGSRPFLSLWCQLLGSCNDRT